MTSVWDAIVTAMSTWHAGKLFVEDRVAISHDALHLILGVVAWLAIALALRRPTTSWHAWLWLFAVIAWNETVDLWIDKWPDPAMQYGEGAKDLLLTMLLPTLLLLAARVRPELFRRAPRRRGGK